MSTRNGFRRGRLLLVAFAVLLVGVAGGATAVAVTSGPSRVASKAVVPSESVAVTRRTLSQTVSASGRVGFGPALPVDVRAAGTLTWLPPLGAVVDRGAVLARVDDAPVALLLGSMPMYRALTVGARGRDVRLLEENLLRLHLRGFSVDDRFTAATAAAVRRWQLRLGVPETGTVTPDRVVVLPTAVRVSALAARLGSQTPGTVLSVTATTKIVSVSLSGDAPGWAEGDQVTLTAAGRQSAGTVTALSRAAGSAGADGSASGGAGDAGTAATGTGDPGTAASGTGGAEAGTTVTVAPADPRRVPAEEGAPVAVGRTVRQRTDVLSVPVAALLALADGGYGVQVVQGTGVRTLAVTTGMFADGYVEVSSPGLRAGQRAVMPS